MKKIFTLIFMLGIVILSFGQETTLDKVVKNGTEMVETIKDNGNTFIGVVKPYIKQLIQGVEQGVDIIITEIPVIIQQYVTFNSIIAWLFVLFGIILIILGIIIPKKFEDFFDKPGMILFFMTVSGGGIYLFISNIIIAIKTTWFPKLYLVEQFYHLIAK